MKNLTWQNPEQLFVAQELINKVKSKCCGIKVYEKTFIPMFLALAYGGLTADAQTTSLVVNPASQASESKSYLLTDIAKITFGDHGMEIKWYVRNERDNLL